MSRGLGALALGLGAVCGAHGLVAEVRPTPSGPRLYIDGAPTAPTLFYVSLWHDPELTALAQREIALACRNGVTIISFAIWGLPWFAEDETPDYGRFDVDVWCDKVLAACPEALLLPRFPCDWPSDAWRAAHPDDLMLFADGRRDGPASLHSPAWRRDAARNVAALVRHLEQRYGDRMVGYHPCGQTSAEWFYEGMWEGRAASFEPAAGAAFERFLRDRYASEAELRRAWRQDRVTFATAAELAQAARLAPVVGAFRDPARDQPVIDFDAFLNADAADAVAAMCRAVKSVAPTKLTVAFYGYHFELAGAPRGLASSGHLGLGRLLASPDVDVLASPVAYGDRQPGGIGAFMAPVDSVQAAGKLWLVEDDTRTHLSAPGAGPGRCADSDQTVAVLDRNFASVLTRGAALWWMDIGGRGWFADEGLWTRLGALRAAYQSALLGDGPRYQPEIAVIVDERGPLYTHPSPLVNAPLLDSFRRQWYRLGAPVGLWRLDDLLAGRVPPARLYLLLDTFRLDGEQLEALRRQVCRDGRTVVWMAAPGIVRDGRLAAEHVAAVTGLRLIETGSGDGRLVLEGTGTPFDAGHGHLSPTFAVDDPVARVLARYADGGVAVAARDLGEWTSVYCGALQMPGGLLRELARAAGVHLFTEQDDPVTCGGGFLSLHASSAGPKRLVLPAGWRLEDALTGAPSEATFTMRLGETRLWRVLP